MSTPTYVPPLFVAEQIARQTLAEAEDIDWDLATDVSLSVHVGALTVALRQLLDAQDQEDGRD
ncbi:hypothetical protein GCM10023347_33750 [Streptomyces chumphonensis]|uniref:Uncharacterized protein n=1 Tax=Streptomyces chumphonensis TaxID=1214925 RepID=A0A927EYY2_9ACTN|nr:hypothetical protein [Streptomyces chumphonensis]MBD3931955.1 hypothetical protein [Streptomyces chumphonensis]